MLKKKLLECSLFISLYYFPGMQQSESVIHIYIYPRCFRLFFSYRPYRVLNRVFVALYGRPLLVVYFIYNRCFYYSFEILFSLMNYHISLFVPHLLYLIHTLFYHNYFCSLFSPVLESRDQTFTHFSSSCKIHLVSQK